MSSFRVSFLSLCVMTTAGLFTGIVGLAIIDVPPPVNALRPTLSTAAGLASHNALVALWPIALIALGWHRIDFAKQVGDALIASQLVLHGLIVGNALGQRTELWRFLPHLPFEWAALALPCAAWFHHRKCHAADRRLGELATITVALLLVAASIETWAVPL